MLGQSRRFALTGLWIVLALATALRFYGLDIQSLWLDELATWAISNYPTLGEAIQQGVRSDVHPPAYQILIFWVERHVGETEKALRLPSAVAGVAAVVMIYLVGVRLYAWREGLLAAALLAVSWTPVYYSQEARPYAFLLLFSLVTFYFWYPIWRIRERDASIPLGTQLAYGVFALLTCYLHYFGLLLVVLQAAALGARFFRAPRHLLAIGALYGFVLVGYAPWLPILLEHSRATGTWIQEPNLESISRYWEFLFKRPGSLGRVVVALYVIFGVRTLRSARGKPARDLWRDFLASPAFVLLLWLVVPFALVYLKSRVSLPLLTDRNLIISLPAAYLLLARSVFGAFHGHVARAVAAGALVLCSLWGLIVPGRYYTEPHKEQLREAARYVATREAGQSDAAIVGYPAAFNYYLEREGNSRRLDFAYAAGSDGGDLALFLARARPQRVWLLAAHLKPTPAMLSRLEERYRQIGFERFNHAWVRRYEAR